MNINSKLFIIEISEFKTNFHLLLKIQHQMFSFQANNNAFLGCYPVFRIEKTKKKKDVDKNNIVQ